MKNNKIFIGLVLIVVASCSTAQTKSDITKLQEEPKKETKRPKTQNETIEANNRKTTDNDSNNDSAETNITNTTDATKPTEIEAASESDSSKPVAVVDTTSDITAEELEQRRLDRIEMASLLSTDRSEELTAKRAYEAFTKERPELQKQMQRLDRIDHDEQIAFEKISADYLEKKAEDDAYRSRRLAKADPDRQRFYRQDAKRQLPASIDILDVRSRSIELVRNRNERQFMAYRSSMKFQPAVQPMTLPGGPAQRLRLYEFLKGRPGNFALLEKGEPVSIDINQKKYRIVNIYSDGNVLLRLQLESEDLQRYFEIAVDDVVLYLE